MRTDLVSAWLIKQWLLQNIPHLANNWPFEASDEIKGFAERIKLVLPNVEAQFLSQNVLAKTVIELWGLQDVALLGGGTPTPLSPSPDRLRYFTDTNPEVVAEAAQAGYTALKVDATNGDDLKKLDGAKTIIATGLFHFLDDNVAQMVLGYMAQTDSQTVVFNNGCDPGREFTDQYSKLGIKLYAREINEVQMIIPDSWRFEQALTAPEVIQHAGEVGEHLTNLPNLYHVYRISRA